MNPMEQPSKLSAGLKIAYSFGQFSDSIPFNLFYTYFLYFLTDVAGLSPIFGGAISLTVVLWDAITDPIVGYLSDHCKSRYGRRRPFMLAALIPLFICTVLLFTKVDFGPVLSFVYYLLIGILFWSAYTMYVIPFFALGAELTQNFDDRNTLRSIAGIEIYVAVWFVSAGPMAILDRTLAAGGTEEQAWFLAAVVVGLIGLAGGLICWRSMRGREIANRDPAAVPREKENILRNYAELFHIKTIRRLTVMILFYCISFSVATAAFVYIMSSNLLLSAAQQAFYWTCYTVMTLLIIPIGNILANRIGKRPAMLLVNSLTIAGCALYFFIGIDSFVQLLLFSFLFQLGNVCFWTIGYSLTYDCCELDEFVNGKRREGAVTGLASFMQKLGSAAGMWISGAFLEWVGYDGGLEIQAADTLSGIITLNTLAPGIFTLAATVFLFLYPINKTNYNNLVAAIALKREGRPYDTQGFEELLK